MEESVDVKGLRARFNAKADMTDSRESSSPKSPLSGLGRGGPLADMGVTVNGAVRHKLMLMAPTTPLPGSSSSPDLQRLPQPRRVELAGTSSPTPRPQLPHGVFPRPPPSHRPGTTELPRPAPLPSDTDRQGRVRLTGDLRQNMMLKHQVAPIVKPLPHSGPQSLPSQRSLTEVTPLRKLLPPAGPKPRKPKRPPHVSLEPYRRVSKAPPVLVRPGLRKSDVGSSSSLPGLVSPSGPPRLPIKPSSLPRQPTHVPIEDDQDTYDDIENIQLFPPPPPPPPNHPGSWDKSDSCNDGSSQIGESDESEVYDSIDDIKQEGESSSFEKTNKKRQKEIKRQQEQERREQKEKHKREIEYKKKFKLDPGVVEVLHTARVRHDWQGGKHDLSVRQGESVEILRVKNNPGGRWLARSLNGTYGYISNTCVDVDYEEVKRKLLQSRPVNSSLPPPPPSPPVPIQDNDIYYDVDSSDPMNSMTQDDDDDDYDDVQGLSDDFPPPPPESLDPEMTKKLEKQEKEFRKKFKYEGPIRVHCTMMVDPNASIKKAGGKDLPLFQGQILEVIQLTNHKKVLCRNEHGKYGYVPRSLLLQAEGDIYDDVDHPGDIYDNEPTH